METSNFELQHLGGSMKNILLFLMMCFAFSSVFSATEKATSSDSEIIAFMIVLNKNEIAAADLTKQKTVNKDIRNYADLMLKEHEKNLNDTEKLSKKQNIEPVDTKMVISLKDKGKKEMNTLTPLTNQAYETAYIDAMVKGHADALANIDSFLKEVKNSKLKTHLEVTRKHVLHHLAKAEEIQKQK